MAPVRIAEVIDSKTFEADCKALAAKYPELDDAVSELRGVLILGYDIPHMPVAQSTPGVFAIKVDYPPLGSAGHGRFIATYHQSLNQEKHAANPMSNPLRVFTLLSLTEL